MSGLKLRQSLQVTEITRVKKGTIFHSHALGRKRVKIMAVGDAMKSLLMSLILLFLTAYPLTSAVAEEEKKDGEKKEESGSSLSGMTSSSFGTGNAFQSLMEMPDTGFDSSKVNAVQNEQNMKQNLHVDQVEGMVRQEQKNPELIKKRQAGSNENATGKLQRDTRIRDPESLTDAEKVLSDEYVHKGRTDRIYREECAGDNLSICEGQEKFGDKTLGVDPQMMGMLAKAYAAIVGMSAGDFQKAIPEAKADVAQNGGDQAVKADESVQQTDASAAEADADPEAAAEADKDDGKVSDYCRYIPMGVELMAFMKQNMAQDHIMNMPSSSATAQKDSLLRAAKSHDERAKQAKIQFAGWGATSACYAAYGAAAGIQMDWKYAMKLGGSLLFTVYYKEEIDRHEGYADTVREIASKIPSKGDCNPVTDTLCYCSEESTKDDVDFCLPQIRQRHINKLAEFSTPCIDDKGQTDVACKCMDEGRCFDKRLESNLLGVGFSQLDMKGIRPAQELARGSLSSGSLNTARQTQSAINNRLKRGLGNELNQAASKIDAGSEQGNIKLLSEKGLPGSLAKILATAPMSAAAQEKLSEMQANQNSFGAGYKFPAVARPAQSGSQLRRSGGSGLNAKKEAPVENNQFNDIFNKFNQDDNQRETASDNVLTFAERASQQAQISKNQDKFLFDIISNRYRLSAWNRFEFDQSPVE